MIDIIHQTTDLLVLNKPSGVSVLADRTGAPSLWPQLQAAFDKPRMVHRIDKGTSGVLLVALSQTCQQALTRAFTNRQIGKHYVAVTAGHLPGGRTLTVDLPLKRGRKSRFRVAGLREEIRGTPDGWIIDATQDGLRSVTRVRVLKLGTLRSLLAVQPLTGRSHQIRVHLAWVGHAVVGDHLYGKPESQEQAWPRLALHCHRLKTPGYGTFAAPLPDDLAGALV